MKYYLVEDKSSLVQDLDDEEIFDAIIKEKPVGVKGNLLKSAFITSTMGVSYKLKLNKNI